MLYTDEMLFHVVVELIEFSPVKEEDIDKSSPRVPHNPSRKGPLSRREKTIHVAQKRAKKDEEEQVGRYYKKNQGLTNGACAFTALKIILQCTSIGLEQKDGNIRL